MNPDGSGLAQLTHTKPGRFAGDPSFSPDGSRIVFEKGAADRALLWMMDTDGSNKHLLADDRRGTFNVTPVFTPDGTRIVYARCWQFTDATTGERHFTCRIYSIATDGSDRRGITTTKPALEVFDSGPAVSPDGSSIAIERHNQNYDGILGQLYVMGIDGSNQRALTAPELEGWGPDWSPDGTHIAFSSACCRRIGSSGYVMNANGANVQRLTTTAFLHNDVNFTYSPDGTRMVFASDRNFDDLCCTDVFVMNADGTQQTLLAIGLPAPHDFSWGSAAPIASASGWTFPSMPAKQVSSRVAAARCSVVPWSLTLLGCR